MSFAFLSRPPATTNSVTGTPLAAKVSTIMRVPNAVDSSSARYTSSARVARVWPMIRPESSVLTSTLRLPLIQSRATRPWAPTGASKARSVRCWWTLVPAAAASCSYRAGTWFLTYQAKMSPTPDCPASYPHSPSTMPPSTTPHIPGTSARCGPFMTWQVLVPMIASIWPGSTARAAGAVTCASTLPTATAMPSGSPVQAAASAVRVPAAAPRRPISCASLVSAKPAKSVLRARSKSLPGYAPSCRMPL